MLDYKALVAGGCPWCANNLVIRKGRYGEFVACAEWCGYTKSIPGRSDYPPKPKTKCTYGKCNGSGLLPFSKDGKVIPNVSVHCDCYQDARPECYQDLTPDCFDYPMSSTFRAASFAYCGVPDPAPNRQPITTSPTEQVIVHRHSNMGTLESDLLQQTAGKLEHVSKSLKEHLNWKTRTSKGLYDSV